jgi:large subunit ribosomal protein L31
MKKGIHPEYREVVFKDVAQDFTVLTKSTVQTNATIEYNGKTYPLYSAEISSASHPFYTGTQKIMDTEGRIDKFKKKYARFRKTV